jgi:hypothetical protein
MTTTPLNALVAQDHVNELKEHARRWRRAPEGFAWPSESAVELRLAGAEDARAVRRLADLDDAPELDGRALLALVDGEPVAAISLMDGRVVANPFVRTQHAVTLLRMRADHLLGVRAPRRRRWIPRVRFA